ncbi:MAG: cytochrome c maturation protein CcmE, partial [Acidobacteriota bacterium]
MNGKTALVSSILVVIAALGFLVYTGLTDNMVYYYHVDEFLPKASSLKGEVIKVNGKVQQ